MRCMYRYFSEKNRKLVLQDEVLLAEDEQDHDAVLRRRSALDTRRTHYPITYKFAGSLTVLPYCEEIPDEENDRSAVWHHTRLTKDTLRFFLESIFSRFQGMFTRSIRSHAEDDPVSVRVPQQRTVFTYQDEKTDPFVRFYEYYDSNDWSIPSVSRRWRQDAEFARQMIGGLDPTYLTRVTRANYSQYELKNFTQAQQDAMLPPGTTLMTLIDEHRLYVVSLPELTGYPTQPGKFVCDPIALFWVNERKTLMPLAIQLTQNLKPRGQPVEIYTQNTVISFDSNQSTPQAPPPPPQQRQETGDDFDRLLSAPSENHAAADTDDREHPAVFTPNDPAGIWLLAKMHVQCSLVTNHSVRTHLFYCHLVSETIYISMCRHLSERHPIHAMLRPHFWYLLKLNYLARDLLASPTGILAELFGLDGVVFTLKGCLQDLDMKKHMHFPTHLEVHGMTPEETKSALPDFHFRDDGLKLWEIYKQYCADVVHQVYGTEEGDAKLQRDLELQSWVENISTPWPTGCGLQNLPVDSNTHRVSSTAQLIELLTMILFNGSVKHAAVNDPQGEYVTFVPNQPMCLRARPPVSNQEAGITEEHIAKHLPTMKESLLQMSLCMNLTTLGFETSQSLLNMQSPFPTAPAAAGLTNAFGRFKNALKRFSVAVQTRNAQLDFPFPYMDPRTITQSIMM